MKKQLINLLVTVFLAAPLFAQEYKMPVLSPYVLFAKGDIVLPEGIGDKLYLLESNKMEIKDLPKKNAYRSLAFFENDSLITLHVLFGETGDGLSMEDYQSLKNLFHKLWDYPSLTMKDRKGKGNIAEVWETTDFRIEWIYKDQDGAGDRKMGWLFIYNRGHHISSY